MNGKEMVQKWLINGTYKNPYKTLNITDISIDRY